ncbi:MAG: hypothetical protein C6H99_01460 [Epsilonproteobacteria bacterium]|nr:hypothetical protein [Campylobacterota bacterium]NPA63902.1 hypothetical protein [Campylobacterota bacterium]
MAFYHLSHTDLDGYTCQYITKQLYPQGRFFNANYGEEVQVRIDQILDLIAQEQEPSLFLITDLNLNDHEASYLDQKIKKLESVELMLLDHHASGLETSLGYGWYHLDVTKSASLITFERFKKESITHLEPLVRAVNAVDIWLQEDRLFEFGKVLMRLVDEAKEINRYTFNEDSIAYKHAMLQSALPYLERPDGHIALDDDLCKIKKAHFLQDGADTLDNLLTAHILKLLASQKERMSISFQEYKGILTYGIQNSSIVGNAFLKANPDFHFFMNVSPRGTFSLRADNKMDVSKMAQMIAGGGGHPNASGGKIEDFREFFVYEDLRSFIQELLERKG